MGKFTRKAKVTLDVAVMDAPHSSLGVRTRAKTLALQRVQGASQAPPDGDVCYLELRSRRLEKSMQRKNSRSVRQGCGCRGEAGIGGEELRLRSVIDEEGLGTEMCFGGNDLNPDTGERGTRESTPSNLIRPANTITTPCSTIRQMCSNTTANRRVRNVHVADVPSAHELEEFFSLEEQSLQQRFIDKYNFDILNDLPLPGRYEWVAVNP